ncbi:DUF3833 family protein [Aestuariivirga sp.]|uniref:DUF3833 family protein n=1 Tax=Aestuariivirga sp. TaxID=2650926 RepID=UPI00391C6B78
MLKRNETAAFDLLSYFEGTTTAVGVFEDRRGRIKRRFAVELTGRARGSALVLDERFLFDDGERQTRVWTLTRGTGEGFAGRCEDSTGEARGRFLKGCATLESELLVRVGSRKLALRFDDVFYDAGAGAVLNRSTVSKWGIRLGQVLILFRKPAQGSP